MVVAQRAEQDEQHERDQHALLRRPGEAEPTAAEVPGWPLRRSCGLLRCCDQTAPAMIAPLTTSAAASGTPLASSV